MSTNMMSRAGGGTTTANAAAAAPANDAAEYSKNIAGKKKKATFECQHCARKFATRSHLVRHSRVHTGERRYACDYPGCEMRCSRKDNLQQHYRTHLVVNPRRANAQSALNTAHNLDPEPADQSHDFSDVNNKATSPVDMKPIPVNGLGDGLMSIASNVNLPHNGANLNATANDGENPEREWSISPPPLSSAYDYWYQHGCLPHTVRNPASVSGSGSSGATSPAMSNALELAPGQMQHHQQRTYMESPTTFYTPHSMHHHNGTGITTSTNANGPYAFEGENTATAMRTSYPLGTATFPTAAEYQHAAPSSHQRSHSHSSYTLGGSTAGTGYPRMGYESATASPQLHHSHLHHHHQQQQHHNGHNMQTQARHHSYSTDSYSPSVSYPGNASRTLAAPYNPGTTPTAGGSYNASASSPTVQTHPSTFHGHHHSHSADSRPVTRHGSMGASNPYSLPVYPSHPHSGMPYGVVDMPSQAAAPHHGHYESPVQRHSMPNSPRMATSHVQPANSSSSSLVLPPIRFADGEMSMGGHFTSGNGWERVNISDARALPPQGAPGMAR
ncbi:hypothetical protein CPB86DRAFT_402060 [Serendipita vermifera]|nr:hypothetical protein CPB86DRAFT_402060 [Serendipita vermifera]